MILEAEKFHYLLSASWRPRGAGGCVPGHVRRPKNGRTESLSAGPSPKAQEPGVPMSKGRWPSWSRENKSMLPLFFLFYLDPQQIGHVHPHCWRPSSVCSLPIQMLISSENILTDTPIKMFYQLSGHPLAQSNWLIKFTITVTIYFQICLNSNLLYIQWEPQNWQWPCWLHSSIHSRA